MPKRDDPQELEVNVRVMIELHPDGYVAYPRSAPHLRMVDAEKWRAVQKVLSATAAYLDI